MEVTFTKTGAARYTVTVVRDIGPELATRQAPGYDPYLPHDLVHFVVEGEAGITDGVFGMIAAGDCTIFWPADPRERQRQARRRKQRPKPASTEERAGLARSELLAGACPLLWEHRSGRRATLPRLGAAEDALGEVDPAVVERILDRFDEIGSRWHALPAGGAITLTWPHPEGRRPARNAPEARRKNHRHRRASPPR